MRREWEEHKKDELAKNGELNSALLERLPAAIDFAFSDDFVSAFAGEEIESAFAGEEIESAEAELEQQSADDAERTERTEEELHVEEDLSEPEN